MSSGKIPGFHTGSGVGKAPFLSCTFEAGGCSHISNSAQAGQQLCQGHYPAAPTALGTQQGAASRKCIKDESAREKGPLGQLPASQLFILHNFQQITGCLLVLIYN